MYIGRLGTGSDPEDGIYILLKEVIDNSIDEFIMGHGNKIDVAVGEDSKVVIRDFGRGIPLGKIVECVSVINTGAKYSDDVFQFSVGLNGVGTKAVNALSSHFMVKAVRDGKYAQATFSKGTLLKQNKGKCNEENGTYVEFIPDEGIFDQYDFNSEYIERRMWNYACLNSGLVLNYNGQKFETKKGLLDFLSNEVGNEGIYEPAYSKSQYLEFSFTHTNNYGESYFSFVNGQFTNDGGTHLSAFREGILKGVNEYFKKSFNGIDIREGIIGTVAVKLKNPVFESQTKNKLGNTDVRGWIVSEVKEAVVDFLHKNKNSAKCIENKIAQNESLRKELNTVKKEAKENAKKISIKIPKLKDCKYHKGDKKFGEESMIFITEGQSAAGSIVSCRDVNTQSIFTLKGKPQNVYGKNKAAIYKNEELYYLMMALGIEEDIENLRFNKIIIATDADVDGFHIRNLLLTFMLNYFEDLILSGHVYILETPIFRVRNKSETIYCYSDKEKERALKKIRNPEITRFKGLGEISPKEFGQFIGDDMKIVKVGMHSVHEMHETLEFYMGKNTPSRKEYIMENLV
ncbi:MAG: ATP-binding protein [Planctomycetes bacterium]|nr:ATP-binding protein [Planctomycetota bacterium]